MSRADPGPQAKKAKNETAVVGKNIPTVNKGILKGKGKEDFDDDDDDDDDDDEVRNSIKFSSESICAFFQLDFDDDDDDDDDDEEETPKKPSLKSQTPQKQVRFQKDFLNQIIKYTFRRNRSANHQSFETMTMMMMTVTMTTMNHQRNLSLSHFSLENK